MDYFRLLNLKREPFSNSPDPDVFYQSRQHQGCLQKLELSIRMRRGLNVVIGEVGTGKTTICRQLIRKFGADKQLESHLVLDPYFSAASEFLATVAGMFGVGEPGREASDWQLKESIKQYLFKRGVDENKTVLLIIDEGQKIPDFCLELLREFLNYETNEYKLLQIVIFAQQEFEETIRGHENFADRISLYHILEPLGFQETRAMVRFRLDSASVSGKGPRLFSFLGLWVVYRLTKGYPRKIINLCHLIVLTMIVRDRSRAGVAMVLLCAKRLFPEQVLRWQRVRVAALACVMVLALFWGAAEKGMVPGALKDGGAVPTPPVTLSRAQFSGHPEPVGPGASPPQKGEVVQAAILVSQIGAEPALLSRSEPAIAERDTGAAGVQDADDKEAGFFGQVRVHYNETLGAMIHRVYGVVNADYLQAILRANPQITNPNRIEVGDLVRFPLLPVMRQVPANGWRVQLAVKNNFETAYKFLREHDSKKLPLRMIPVWGKQERLQYAIVLKESYFDGDAAGRALLRIPPEMAPGALVVSGMQGVFSADAINDKQLRAAARASLLSDPEP